MRRVNLHKSLRCLAAAWFAVVLLTAPDTRAATINIVAFGTSTTSGGNVARGEDYPSKLEAALKARGHDVKVTNAGKTGDTVAGAFARLDAAVPQDTHIAIVEIGSNDRRAGFPAAAIQAGLDRIVDRLRERNIEVLIANYMDVTGGGVARGTYFTQIDVSRIPMDFRVADDPYFHLTAPGYEALAKRLLPQVELLIARVKSANR